MRAPEPPPPSLAGSLLIAHPGLLDPNFRRSVLLLTASDAAEGSFGLALNRPAGRTVGELLPEREMGALATVPVFVGGPVATDQLIFATFQWSDGESRWHCRHHLGIDEAERALREDDATVRAFVGYAGWGKGQLEKELGQRAWLLKQPDAATLDAGRCEALWKDLTGSFGPWFRVVADAPDDLSRS